MGAAGAVAAQKAPASIWRLNPFARLKARATPLSGRVRGRAGGARLQSSERPRKRTAAGSDGLLRESRTALMVGRRVLRQYVEKLIPAALTLVRSGEKQTSKRRGVSKEASQASWKVATWNAD